MSARTSKRERAAKALVYDIFLWIFTVVVDLFFREIHPRSTWRIPKKGPVIFVAAPHANQFVDPLILMRVVRHDAGRRIAFLVAEKSMRRAFIGFAAGLVGSVPVGRALDLKKPAEGLIFLPDPDNDPTLVKGTGVNFKSEQFMPGGILVLPSIDNVAANAEIDEILSSDEIRLKKPFKGDVAIKQLTGRLSETTEGADEKKSSAEAQSIEFQGVKFSVAPHVDQSKVYESVFRRINEGGCIGIFPEGGSHDRTDFLPLKAGLAIMALGALAENPDCGVTIVPVGMNYFHAHKFRSRAVIEFGAPIEISPDLVDQYKNGNRREAVGAVLQTVYDRLRAVTVQAPDYDTLMLIQAVRRLYNPKGKALPLPFVIELNRRFIKGYTTYKDDPRVVKLRKAVLDYNKQLFRLNIRDHQVSYAKFSWYRVIFTLIYRLGKLLLLSGAVIPGVILFAPVFICGKIISRIKAREALAASTVKIKARDVMATWKILVSLALAPALGIIYTTLLAVWTYYNRVGGYIPDWVPLWLVVIAGIILLPALCFAALRFGEIGMDIFKSLRPLLLSLNPTQSNTLVKLRKERERLQDDINEIVSELGPELFPDFDHQRIISDPNHPLHSPARSRPTTPTARREGSEHESFQFTRVSPGDANSPHMHLPQNDNLGDIGSIGLFANRPDTPNRSRSRGGSHDGRKRMPGFTSIEPAAPSDGKLSKSNLDEVSKNLHEAMRVRGRRRKSEDAWEIERNDAKPPTSADFEPSEAKKDL